jgi:tetratricopeptide (TPR) repeat protein
LTEGGGSKEPPLSFCALPLAARVLTRGGFCGLALSMDDLPKIVALVQDAIRARDAKRAAALAEPALAAGAQHPILFNARALHLVEQNRHADALAEFNRAQALAPDHPAIKTAMAQSLATLGRWSDAAQAYDAALPLVPEAQSAPLHTRKGWALEMAEDLEGARAAYERAVAIDAEAPEALARLAYLAARRGAWPEARDLAERALARDSRQIAASLALASADIGEGRLDGAGKALDGLLANDAVRGVNREMALGLKGDLRDAERRPAEAFAAYSEANAVAARTFADRGDRQTMAEAVAALTAFMQTAAPRPATEATGATRMGEAGHVFLLGFPRSGTTLLEQVFASHPDAVTLGEKDTLADGARAFLGRPQDLNNLWAASEDILAFYRETYWRRVREFGVEPRGKVFVDKTPINSVKLPLIAQIFPDAKVLFALRDPRDVVLSCFRRRFGASETAYEFLDLARAARFYDAVMTLAEIYRAKLPLTMMALRHEDVVTRFEPAIGEVCRFAGLDWNDAMRDFAVHRNIRTIATPSAAQIARGLSSEGVGQWRRYERQLAPVQAVLRPWVERFGYPPR